MLKCIFSIFVTEFGFLLFRTWPMIREKLPELLYKREASQQQAREAVRQRSLFPNNRARSHLLNTPRVNKHNGFAHPQIDHAPAPLPLNTKLSNLCPQIRRCHASTSTEAGRRVQRRVSFSTVSVRDRVLPDLRPFANVIVLSRLFGFLLGSTLAGAGVYYYVLDEYKVSNSLLTEDIYVRPPQLLCPFPTAGSAARALVGIYTKCMRCWHRLTNIKQSLQASVQRVHTYVQTLEEKIIELEKKKK